MTIKRKLGLITLIALLFCAVSAPARQTTAPAVGSSRWEAEIRRFEEADRAAPPPKGAVLFVGSSSIRLWPDLAQDFTGTAIINRGFGGSQIEDSTFYANRLVVPHRPRLILLYAGDNDLAQGKTPAQVLADFQAFVARVRRDLPETRIAFISIKPSPARWHLVEQMKAANELVRRYAAGDKKLAYIDIFTPMLGPDGQTRPELYVADKLHLSRQGYDIWRDVIAPYLK